MKPITLMNLLLVALLAFLGAAPTVPPPAEQSRPEPPLKAPEATVPGAATAPRRATGRRPSSVLWRTWSPRTLEAAREADRPILLFLTNPWNTLGSVMDANTFSDARVAGAVRDFFVPVRVDVDRRPDLEERFGAGELPGVAVVMPSGESLYLKAPQGSYIRAVGSYFGPEELYHWLRSVADYFRDNRQILDIKIADIVERFRRKENLAAVPLDAGIVDSVATALREKFDRTHAGFGLSPKVPDAQALHLCWHLARLHGDVEARELGLRTVRAVLDSALHDRVEGGVFRLAKERDWSSPRYEKVLEVNARWLEVLAEGSLLTGERWIEKAARQQAEFLIERFGHPDGGFKRAQGPGDPFGTYFTLGRRKRLKMVAPPIEPTRIVSWNAHAASAMVRTYQATGDERYLEQATATLEFLLGRCRVGSRGMVHYFDGRTRVVRLLVDQVAMARALVDAYQATGRVQYLIEASKLASVVRTYFRDQATPRFVDRVPDPNHTGAMKRPDRDLVDNSEFAMLLQDLAVLTDRPELNEVAARTLEMYADEVGIYGIYASPLARAVDRALRAPARLLIASGGQGGKARKLARAAASIPDQWLLVDWLQQRSNVWRPDPEEREALEAVDGAAAVLVIGEWRSEPLTSAEEVLRAAALPQARQAERERKAASGARGPRSWTPSPQTRSSQERR
ncbi:MAG: DUF255 domain-containing protein [Acidobacteriota bacterium]